MKNEFIDWESMKKFQDTPEEDKAWEHLQKEKLNESNTSLFNSLFEAIKLCNEAIENCKTVIKNYKKTIFTNPPSVPENPKFKEIKPTKLGINFDKKCISLVYDQLKKIEEGKFRRECPFCTGCFNLQRDKEGKLLPNDRCCLCGQAVYFTDL